MPRLIDADVYREQLWTLCEELFADKPTNYEFNTMLDLIDNQPTVGGWIPVSEKLPEAGMKVLVVSNNDVPVYCVAIMMNGELRVTWNHDRFEHIKIVAWQPLPEPYNLELLKESD